MGLGFFIGQGGVNNLGEYLGDLSAKEHVWLNENGFLYDSMTGHLPEDPRISLPFYDDVILTHAEILIIKSKFDSRKRELFESQTVEDPILLKMEQILNKILGGKKGLSTLSD